jgi:DNA polymerase III subunit epsilon
MLLFFDTETTGIPSDRLPPNHECQPHIVQIAALLTEEDGTERASINLIVNPPTDIPQQASDVHGITNEIATSCGLSPVSSIALFGLLANKASRIIAHNIKFDLQLVETCKLRCDRHFQIPSIRICTMEIAAPIVNLPPTERMLRAGFNKPKAPKLEECIQHFFDENLNGAHDAMVDVRACARLYFHLRGIGAIQ